MKRVAITVLVPDDTDIFDVHTFAVEVFQEYADTEEYEPIVYESVDALLRDEGAGELVCADCGTKTARTYLVTVLDHNDPKNTRTETCALCAVKES